MSVIPRQSSTAELGVELGVAPNLEERNTEKREEGGRGETLFLVLAVVKAWNFRRGGGGLAVWWVGGAVAVCFCCPGFC
jgi:hypothetical protein